MARGLPFPVWVSLLVGVSLVSTFITVPAFLWAGTSHSALYCHVCGRSWGNVRRASTVPARLTLARQPGSVAKPRELDEEPDGLAPPTDPTKLK